MAPQTRALSALIATTLLTSWVLAAVGCGSATSYSTVFVPDGDPEMARAIAEEGAAPFKPDTLEAKYSLAELGERGYRPTTAQGHALDATLVTFEGNEGTEHWLGFKNFYVITRYNRSPMYAMAVYQLSREIAAGQDALAAP